VNRQGGAARWLSRALRSTAVVLVAVIGMVSVALAPAALVTHAYDSVGYSYDAPAELSSPDTVTTYVRGSPERPGAVSWGRSAFVRDDVDAANAEAGASRVNPLGGTQNCVNCAIAGDHTLAGYPTSALDSAGPQLVSRIEQHFGASFRPVGGRADIEGILSNAGSGSRGIVFGARGSDPGHVFNAVNQGGVVRFIDFQNGRAASFNGYSSFSFLRTN
jgi:hypothetical protein